MSQKLSFSSIAATLAVLSASGLVACAGNATPPAETPADAKEVSAGQTSSATAAVDQEPGKEGVLPSESASGSTANAVSAAEQPKAPADVAATAPAAAPATAPAKAATPAAKKKHAGAKGGCGAGTCG